MTGNFSDSAFHPKIRSSGQLYTQEAPASSFVLIGTRHRRTLVLNSGIPTGRQVRYHRTLSSSPDQLESPSKAWSDILNSDSQ